VKKSLFLSSLLFVICGVFLYSTVFAAGSTGSPVDAALARDFPKLQFESIQPTEVDGLFEVVAGANVLYYSPKKGVILFGELFSKDWRNQTAGARSRLMAAVFKEVQFDQSGIQSPVEGLYEVLSDQNVVYFDPKSGAKLIGDMYTKDGKNLTAESRDNATAQVALKELPLEKAIKIGNGKTIVIMFTDPDCPYCRKIEGYFKDRKDITRYVYLLPLEQIHPKATDKSRIILCSKNKTKAFLDAMGGSLDTGELKPCNDEKVASTLNENKSMAQRLGIQGTPYLIVNGVAVRGADTRRIDELLNDKGNVK